MHDRYVRGRVDSGEAAAGNDSLLPWGELPEALRESNREFARSIAAKLSIVGWELVDGSAGAAASLEAEPAEVEQLAVCEHERWRRDLEAAGWVRGSRRDPAQRSHPMLVDWDELPESERDKDRDAVRAIPELLAAAGYSLRRTR